MIKKFKEWITNSNEDSKYILDQIYSMKYIDDIDLFDHIKISDNENDIKIQQDPFTNFTQDINIDIKSRLISLIDPYKDISFRFISGFEKILSDIYWFKDCLDNIYCLQDIRDYGFDFEIDINIKERLVNLKIKKDGDEPSYEDITSFERSIGMFSSMINCDFYSSRNIDSLWDIEIDFELIYRK